MHLASPFTCSKSASNLIFYISYPKTISGSLLLKKTNNQNQHKQNQANKENLGPPVWSLLKSDKPILKMLYPCVSASPLLLFFLQSQRKRFELYCFKIAREKIFLSLSLTSLFFCCLFSPSFLKFPTSRELSQTSPRSKQIHESFHISPLVRQASVSLISFPSKSWRNPSFFLSSILQSTSKGNINFLYPNPTIYC